MNNYATSRASFWLGIALGAILAAALLFSVYYVPRKGLSFGKESLHFTVVLHEAHGLRVGSPVLVSGIEAGEVSGVRIAKVPDFGWRVLAGVEIFDGARFKEALTTKSTFAVHRSSLLGEMAVAIAPGGDGNPLTPGILVDGVAPTDFGRIVEDVSTLTRRLADFVDGRKRGDPSLRRALIDIQNLVRNLRNFSEKLPQ